MTLTPPPPPQLPLIPMPQSEAIFIPFAICFGLVVSFACVSIFVISSSDSGSDDSNDRMRAVTGFCWVCLIPFVLPLSCIGALGLSVPNVLFGIQRVDTALGRAMLSCGMLFLAITLSLLLAACRCFLLRFECYRALKPCGMRCKRQQEDRGKAQSKARQVEADTYANALGRLICYPCTVGRMAAQRRSKARWEVGASMEAGTCQGAVELSRDESTTNEQVVAGVQVVTEAAEVLVVEGEVVTVKDVVEQTGWPDEEDQREPH